MIIHMKNLSHHIRPSVSKSGVLIFAGIALFVSFFVPTVFAQNQPADRAATSYAPVAGTESFESIVTKMKIAKEAIQKQHRALLEERYDLADRSSDDFKMSRGKAVQSGVRVKLPDGTTWNQLAVLKPDEIRAQGVWPKGFLPLPHPNHPEGGMLFPKLHIAELKKQTGRDLERFDLDFAMPDQFLPEYPPAIYLTTRPDLGDVSQGEVITSHNYFRLFNGVLNPKQLDGLRLLVSPVPQQQFNLTDDRRSIRPSLGVTCFDCHVNGHTNATTHLAGDVRPQHLRHRIDTPSLRGVNVQQIFGSQRALKSIEDFTEFEQRAAYFDGDPVIATKKGVSILERGSEVHNMAEFQAILDFPPAPKLSWDGKLDPEKANEQEMRGQELFFGKAKCASCHSAPYYTDGLMHNLQTERFFEPVMVNGRLASADGAIKTFPLRGIKDSPPYLHDGRLLTLADTIEFFNLTLSLKLSTGEKDDLLSFLKCL